MKKLNKLFIREDRIGDNLIKYRLTHDFPYRAGDQYIFIDKETADQIRATQSLELLDLN